MTSKIRIGIACYGNLGRGMQAAIAKNPDMELVGVYTRRDPQDLQLASPAPRFAINELQQHTDQIDVLILCGGSKSDLPEQGPKYAALYNTVDSFDPHARIPEYFETVDAPAKGAGKTALISAGWDPGMFSINRVYGEALLPDRETYTFWGRGLSQGHSDAVRRVPGVATGVQYTIPSQEAIDRVRDGERPTLGTREKHQRECSWCSRTVRMPRRRARRSSPWSTTSTSTTPRLNSSTSRTWRPSIRRCRTAVS